MPSEAIAPSEITAAPRQRTTRFDLLSVSVTASLCEAVARHDHTRVIFMLDADIGFIPPGHPVARELIARGWWRGSNGWAQP